MASLNDFDLGEELGGGSWSTVVEAVHKPTSKKYAIKILSKAQLIKHNKVPYAVIEKNALATLSKGGHPGFVRFHATFQDSVSLYFVLSLAPNGDLKEAVKEHGSLSLSCARYYTAQLVDAVQWMHRQGVLHRDLKPENILLDVDMRIKIADFGSAYVSKDLDLSPRPSTFVGTAAYVSPELLNRTSKSTSRSSDIWAIGCILYFLMAGRSPFLAVTDYLSFKKIEALDYTFPNGFDADAEDLVRRLLVLQPSDRLGVQPKSSESEIREHPFFVGLKAAEHPEHPKAYIDWDKLWKDPPVPIETGLVRPPSPEPWDEADQQKFWDNVVHEFSLAVNVSESRGNERNSTELIEERASTSQSSAPTSPRAPSPTTVERPFILE